MKTATVEIKGQTYQLATLPAITQFHVSRRLGPILATVGISIQMLKSGLKLDLDDFVPMLEPVLDVMAKMKDEDVNYVMFTCLGAVKRLQGENKWAPVTTAGSLIMFEDIGMDLMLRLVIEVLKENLGPFLMELGEEPKLPSSAPNQ